MLFERLTAFHGLNNLLWVFNANEIREKVDPYPKYYPGGDAVDVLATDVYRGGFAREDYDGLLARAGDKPIALGEAGAMPTPEILRRQPRWTWCMRWGDPSALWNERESAKELFETKRPRPWKIYPG
jgi:mannan endo-1,4-beta-mannosidase